MSSMPPQPAARRGTPWTLIIGGVIALLAVLLCVGGGILTVGPVQDLVDQPMRTGSHVVELEEGESVGVWSEDDLATCSVTGPSGPVDDAGGADQSVTWGDRELGRVMVVEAEESGSHTITCSAPFVVGEGFPVPGVIAMVIGGSLCCISVVVIVIGLVLWLTKRRR